MTFSCWIYLVFMLDVIDESHSNIQISPQIIVGDEKLTHQYRPISKNISKLRLDGPFYCYVKWTTTQPYVDIYTDNNIHSYIKMEMKNQTLKFNLPSTIDFKFTKMYMNFYLNPNIDTIHLSGLTHLRSVNILSGKNRLKIDAEDTSSFHLHIDISYLEVHFLSAGFSVIQGQVQQTAMFIYRGIADLDASNLICQRIDVEANGLGTISIFSSNECFIRAAGVTTIKYHCVHVNQTHLTDLAKLIRL